MRTAYGSSTIWFDMNLIHILYVRLGVRIIIETFFQKSCLNRLFFYLLFSATATLFNWNIFSVWNDVMLESC